MTQFGQLRANISLETVASIVTSGEYEKLKKLAVGEKFERKINPKSNVPQPAFAAERIA